MPVAALISEIRPLSRCSRTSPRAMLRSNPCMLPTAGANTSTPVDATNWLACSAVVRICEDSGTVS
jgi:hypothetical protein